jgi:hypothetical protein
MPWKEISKGKYTRPLDNLELLLKEVSARFTELNREHRAINFIAHFHLSFSEHEEIVAALRSAWIALRYHHPHIATVLEDISFRYDVPDAQGLETWLKESFIIHKGSETLDKYLAPAPLMLYASLHYFPPVPGL